MSCNYLHSVLQSTGNDKERAMSLTVRLDETIENELQRYCQTQEVSKSSVVHEALKYWLAEKTTSGNALLSFASSSSKSAKSYVAYSKQALRAKLQAKASKA
jgi:Arc/MetJ-type ribon-helix-helix transcriptional regulator